MSRAVIGFIFFGIWKCGIMPFPKDLLDGLRIFGREAILLGPEVNESVESFLILYFL